VPKTVQTLTTLGEFLCALLVAVGVGLHDLGAGLIVGGLLGLLLSLAASRTIAPKTSDELTLDDLAHMLAARVAEMQERQP
jgi:hypothetical protein